MNTKVLVMDVDGTLTDGSIYISSEGECMKAFHVQDGYGIAHVLPQYGITPVIITGRYSRIVEQRAKELGISYLYQGISDKLKKLMEVSEELSVDTREIAYIGDDLNDLKCMQCCGSTGCPNDAVPGIADIVDYRCQRGGGKGAVREFIDWLTQK